MFLCISTGHRCLINVSGNFSYEHEDTKEYFIYKEDHQYFSSMISMYKMLIIMATIKIKKSGNTFSYPTSTSFSSWHVSGTTSCKCWTRNFCTIPDCLILFANIFIESKLEKFLLTDTEYRSFLSFFQGMKESQNLLWMAR